MLRLILLLGVMLVLLSQSGCGRASPPETLYGKIVFYSDRDGDFEIYVMNADGSNLVRLTHDMEEDEYPVWSP